MTVQKADGKWQMGNGKKPSALSLPPSADVAPVVIIGGGITGLSAAWELQKQGVPYVLLEAGDYLGGKLRSERTEDGFLVERAADAFILGKPYGVELARELGLEAEAIYPREDTKNLYYLRHGRLMPFPTNLKMFIPLDDDAFRASGVLSPEGTERFLAEVEVPPRDPALGDESLGDFVTRRFGAEAINFIAPIAAGIYVAKPFELSMQAAFPQFLALEQRYGSLIRGSRATPKAVGPVFTSFPGGMGQLVEALAAQLTGEVRLNTPVLRVSRQSVRLGSGHELAASRVIVTVPAAYAAPMLGEYAPASRLIGELKTNSSCAVVLAYRAEQFTGAAPDVRQMHGLLVDLREDTPMTAITVHSSKLAGRAPEGHVLLRVFFRNTEPGTARRIAQAQVEKHLGAQGDPLWHAYGDWRGKNPAYQVGHVDHIARIRAALPAQVQVAGASYTGVGVPDCINAGRTAARNAAQAWHAPALEISA